MGKKRPTQYEVVASKASCATVVGKLLAKPSVAAVTKSRIRIHDEEEVGDDQVALRVTLTSDTTEDEINALEQSIEVLDGVTIYTQVSPSEFEQPQPAVPAGIMDPSDPNVIRSFSSAETMRALAARQELERNPNPALLGPEAQRKAQTGPPLQPDQGALITEEDLERVV